jgi:hypothetical protein
MHATVGAWTADAEESTRRPDLGFSEVTISVLGMRCKNSYYRNKRAIRSKWRIVRDANLLTAREK